MIPQDANKHTKTLIDRPFPFLFSLGGQFANMGELAAATQRLIAKTARAQAHTLVKTSHWKYPSGRRIHFTWCMVHIAWCMVHSWTTAASVATKA
jgi:hypothetical protein